jgi:hypothetical protein
MSFEINDLQLPLQKLIDAGIVDSWLRGIALLTPQGLPDLNHYTHKFDPHSGITPREIERLQGFRQLLQSCAKNDVCVDISNAEPGKLTVAFDPGAPFAQSKVFNSAYARVIPVAFGNRQKN